MLTIKTLKFSKYIRNKLVFQTILENSTAHSIRPVVEDKDYDKAIKTIENITNVTKRIRLKKPNRPPFAKNLFLGKFDNEILTYPQLEKEDFEILQNETSKVKQLLQQSHMVNCKSLAEKSFRQNLSDYKAFGLQAPQLLNARGCNVTESIKFLETLTEHTLGQSLVTHECMGVQILNKFADDVLKKKYLPSLISGETLASLCLSENDTVDITSFETKATQTQDQKYWILNGKKNGVFHGSLASHLIVFAVTEIKYVKGVKEAKLTAFLVNKDSPGVAVAEYDVPTINVADVTFRDTAVPVENIIGQVHCGEKMLPPILTEQRLSVGPMCISLSKKILNNLVKDILKRSNDENQFHKTDAIRGKISEIVSLIYAMESIVYLTTGLTDNYENQDIDLESALVKIFCSEKLHEISLISLDIVGAPAASNSHWANEMNRQVVRYSTLHESNGLLKIMSALLGLQHIGKEIQEDITKLRNPFFYPAYHFKRMWTARKDDNDDPDLKLFLQEHLHPSLLDSALRLNYCVQRLRYGAVTIFENAGCEVLNNHIDLERLANCLLDVYVMTAVLGRASRSYCIGLQCADLEMLIADSYCNFAVDRVRLNIKKLVEEHFATDVNYKMLAKRIFKFKGYCIEHPLKRNF